MSLVEDSSTVVVLKTGYLLALEVSVWGLENWLSEGSVICASMRTWLRDLSTHIKDSDGGVYLQS